VTQNGTFVLFFPARAEYDCNPTELASGVGKVDVKKLRASQAERFQDATRAPARWLFDW
jgi:hypothetical protein